MTPQDLETPPDKPRSESGTGPGPQVGRRRLLRGGLATGPVLLSMVSRPVTAQTICFPNSASYSANISRGTTGFSCKGFGPAYWSKKGSFSNWPSPMAVPGPVAAATPPEAADSTGSSKKNAASNPSTLVDATADKDKQGSKGGEEVAITTFNSVFGNAGGYPKKSLVEVLALNTSMGRDGLASHLAAAYLNALKGLTPAAVLDVPTVKNIWASFVARGYYEPSAGIKWYPDHAEPANPRGGMIAWLKTTMPN